MKHSLCISHFVSLLLIWTNISFSQADKSWGPLKVYGVTVDAVGNINAITDALQRHCMRPTTRILFDEWIPATDYITPVNAIYNVSYIMGEILDSYYMSQYSVQQYVNRTNEYLNLLGGKVYIW